MSENCNERTSSQRLARRPIVTFLSDFGHLDTFVGQMKGVVVSACPEASLIDLTHDVSPQDVLSGAIHLSASWHWFPEDSIHVAVVDPGVGSERRAIGVRFRNHTFLLPDNGLLSAVLDGDPPEIAVELNRARDVSGNVSRTFHGRDVFAFAAGQLAIGVPLGKLGTALDPEAIATIEIPSPEISTSRIAGEVLVIDRFGNAVTNVPAVALGGNSTAWTVTCGEFSVDRLSSTYADVDQASPLAAISSMDTLELAIRDGSAAERYELRVGMPVIARKQ